MTTHRLARRINRELGYDVERSKFLQGGRMKTGWEIKGITRSLIEKFSSRTKQVEEYAELHGIADPAAKASLGVRTREKKDKGVSATTSRL